MEHHADQMSGKVKFHLLDLLQTQRIGLVHDV